MQSRSRNFDSQEDYRNHLRDCYYNFCKKMNFRYYDRECERMIGQMVYLSNNTISLYIEDQDYTKVFAFRRGDNELTVAYIHSNIYITRRCSYRFREPVLNHFVLDNDTIIFVTQESENQINVYLFKTNENKDEEEKEDCGLNLNQEEVNSTLYFNMKIELHRFIHPSNKDDSYEIDRVKQLINADEVQVRCSRKPVSDSTTQSTTPFLDILNVYATKSKRLFITANTNIRGKESCVMLKIDTSLREPYIKWREMDRALTRVRTIRTFQSNVAMFGYRESHLYLIDLADDKLTLHYQNLSNETEFPRSHFSFGNKICIYTSSKSYYTFDSQLTTKIDGPTRLSGVFFSPDASKLHFFRNEDVDSKSTANLLYKEMKINELNLRELVNPRNFRRLDGYKHILGGQLQAHSFGYSRLLLVNKLDRKIIFTLYDCEKKKTVKTLPWEIGPGNCKLKFYNRQLLIQRGSGASKLFDLNIILK